MQITKKDYYQVRFTRSEHGADNGSFAMEHKTLRAAKIQLNKRKKDEYYKDYKMHIVYRCESISEKIVFE